MEIKLSHRLGSMILDHLIMSLLAAAFTSVGFMTSFISLGMTGIGGTLGVLCYLAKDILRGKSAGKRIIGLQIVNIETGLPASLTRTLIRNLTIVIWPIEVFITLFSKQRRLGDFIAGTEVIQSDKEELSTMIDEIKVLVGKV